MGRWCVILFFTQFDGQRRLFLALFDKLMNLLEGCHSRIGDVVEINFRSNFLRVLLSGKGKMNKSVFGLGNILAKVVGLGNFFS